MSRSIASLAVATLLFVTPALAEKNTKLEPKIAKLGTLALEQAFDSPLKKTMVAVKGEWNVVDGVLIGKELASDHHAAVLNCVKQNRNSVVRFSFKFDGDTRGMHFSLNKKRGHLFRVIVSPTKLSINLDKDKKDPASKAVALGNANGKFVPGNWYTMQIEMVGDQVAVQTDNGMELAVSHEKLDVDKPGYRLVMRGNSLSIDDLHVWDVR